MSDLLNAFNDHFELVFANTPELLDEVFRLRYRTICEDMQVPGYEPWRYPDGREVDTYDARSAHCLIRHRSTGQAAGCVRLILAPIDDPSQPFPIESVSGGRFDPAKVNPALLPRGDTAEISRLIVPRLLKNADGKVSPHRSPAFPFPVLGLLAAVMRLSSAHGVTHLYAIMEPLLNRLLRRFSLHFEPIAPPIEYHGVRQAHLGVVADVMSRAYRERREVWNLLTDAGRCAPEGNHWSTPDEPRVAVAAGQR
ncbi:MAG: PEP-CTERM/exosortase system-associated acyltransferase [Thermodesulfobacteriota bacterium]